MEVGRRGDPRAKDKRRVNQSSLDNAKWAQWAATQILVMFAHLRRVASNPRKRSECSLKMSEADRAQLFVLIDMIRQVESTSTTSLAPRRKLRKVESDVTLDSDGYPKILRNFDNDASPESSTTNSSSSSSSSPQSHPQDMQEDEEEAAVWLDLCQRVRSGSNSGSGLGSGNLCIASDRQCVIDFI